MLPYRLRSSVSTTVTSHMTPAQGTTKLSLSAPLPSPCSMSSLLKSMAFGFVCDDMQYVMELVTETMIRWIMTQGRFSARGCGTVETLATAGWLPLLTVYTCLTKTFPCVLSPLRLVV